MSKLDDEIKEAWNNELNKLAANCGQEREVDNPPWTYGEGYRAAYFRYAPQDKIRGRLGILIRAFLRMTKSWPEP